MLKINPETAAFQSLSASQSGEKTRSAPSAGAANAARSNESMQGARPVAAAQSGEASEQTSQSSSVPQDSSETQTHPESHFEPGGAFRFGSDSSEPSFTPLVSQSGASREDIQKSADDSLAQLRAKRIENRLGELAEKQLQQIKDTRQL